MVDLLDPRLDTLAEVYLNGEHILSSSNMFHIHEVNVTPLLRPTNELRIHFASTYLYAKKLEGQHGKLHCFNGDPARLYV